MESRREEIKRDFLSSSFILLERERKYKNIGGVKSVTEQILAFCRKKHDKRMIARENVCAFRHGRTFNENGTNEKGQKCGKCGMFIVGFRIQVWLDALN